MVKKVCHDSLAYDLDDMQHRYLDGHHLHQDQRRLSNKTLIYISLKPWTKYTHFTCRAISLQVNIDTSDCITALYHNGRIFNTLGQSTDLLAVFCGNS